MEKIMKKKIILFLMVCLICLCLTGCADKANKHDWIEIANRTSWIFDNIHIETKDGYFYTEHEKFTVDENTIGVTIYFSKEKDDGWD